MVGRMVVPALLLLALGGDVNAQQPEERITLRCYVNSERVPPPDTIRFVFPDGHAELVAVNAGTFVLPDSVKVVRDTKRKFRLGLDVGGQHVEYETELNGAGRVWAFRIETPPFPEHGYLLAKYRCRDVAQVCAVALADEGDSTVQTLFLTKDGRPAKCFPDRH